MRPIDADALKRTRFEFEEDFSIVDIARALITSIDIAPTIDPESLRSKGRWENGVCMNCKFDLRCLTDGENDLEQWVWDEGFDYCPNCGAKVEIVYCCGEYFVVCENDCMDIPACFHSNEKATKEEWNRRASE